MHSNFVQAYRVSYNALTQRFMRNGEQFSFTPQEKYMYMGKKRIADWGFWAERSSKRGIRY